MRTHRAGRTSAGRKKLLPDDFTAGFGGSRKSTDFLEYAWPGAALIATALVAICYFPLFWKEGIPASVDLSLHFLRAKLISEGYGVYDWYYGMWLGTTPFIFYPPLVAAVIAAIPKITFDFITLEVSFKMVLWLAYWGMVPSVYYSLRRLGFDKASASLASFFSTFISFFAGFGPNALFEIGLLPFAFANLFFLPAIAHLNRYLFEDGSESRIDLFLAIGFSCFVILSDAPVTCFLAVFVLAYFAIEMTLTGQFDSRKLKRLAKYGGSTIALCVFWLLPFIFYRTFAGPDSNWSPMDFKSLMKTLNSGIFFGPSGLNYLSIVGALLAILRCRERRIRIFFYLAVLSLLLGLGWIGHSPFSFLSQIQFNMMNRALTFLAFPIILFSALSFVGIIRYFGLGTNSQLLLVFLIASAFFKISGANWLNQKSPLARTEGDYRTPKDEEFRRVLEWINRNGTAGDVLSFAPILCDASSRSGLDYQHPGLWSLLKTKSAALEGGVSLFSKTSGPIMTYECPASFTDNYVGLLKTWNVRFIVAPSSFDVLRARRIFKQMEKLNNFAVYEIHDNASPWKLVKKTYGRNYVEFNAIVDQEGSFSFPVGYYRNWRVFVDGRLVAYDKDSLNLVRLSLSPGVHAVRFGFYKGHVEYWSLMLSLTALIGFLFLACILLRDVIFTLKAEYEN